MGAHLTAVLLDTIDPGRFERLASHIIRRRYPALIGHGLNAEGKTVADPLDASAEQVWVYHTTQADLNTKWLSENTERPGDLTQAIQRAAGLRAAGHNPPITVILATSRRVSSQVEGDARERARDAGLQLEIVEQSIIVDYLDTNPDGQFVRRLFFEIGQERLNRDLLRALTRLSVAQYGHMTYAREAGALVHRDLDDLLDLAMMDRQRIRFLVGLSGHGKTRALHKALIRQRMKGGYAIWIPPEVVQTAARLEVAIAETLRQLVPELHPSCGQTAIQLARESGFPLLIAVDDLNSLPDPVPAASKLASWSSSSVDVTAFVPLWPSTWDALPEDARKRARDVVTVGRFAPDEAVAAVRTRVTDVDYLRAREIASLCAYDPLLIALLPPALSAIAASRGGEIVRAYIGRIADDLARRHRALAEDYHEVLRALGGMVINSLTLAPRLLMVQSAFPDGSARGQRLRELLTDGRLIDQAGGHVRFRHDRLRDALVADFIVGSPSGWVNSTQLADPFFSEAVGLAIAIGSPSADMLAMLAEQNPLALAYSVMHFGNPQSDAQEQIVDLLQHVINENVARLPPEYIHEMDQIFSRLDDDVVIRLTDGARYRFVRARFVNGDADLALAFALQFVDHDYIDTEEWIRRACEKAAVEVTGRVVSGLTAGNDDARIAALAIAPFLRERITISDVLSAYRTAEHPQNVLAATLTATLLYEDGSTLPILLDALYGLPEQADDNAPRVNTRGSVADEVGRRTRVAAGPNLDTLTAWAENDDSKRWLVAALLARSDVPQAVEFCIRAFASIYNPSNVMGATIGLHYLTRPWEEPYGNRLSEETSSRVRDLWNDRSQDRAVRSIAWRYWVKTRFDADSADGSDQIQPDDHLYDEALWFRVSRGDVRVRDAFLERLRANDANWLRLASSNWTEAVRDEVFRFTEGLHDGSITLADEDDILYGLAEMLRDIPDSDADEFFRRFGDKLYHLQFFLAALYVGTEHAMAYVEAQLAQTDSPGSLVMYLDQFFGFKNLSRSDRITPEMILRIEPFLAYLDQHELIDIRGAAKSAGLEEWIHTHVDPLLATESRRHVAPTLEDQFARLDSVAVGYASEGRHWYESFERRGEPSSKAMEIAREWFLARGTAAAMNVLMNLSRAYGSRSDVLFIREHLHPMMGPAVGSLSELAAVVARRSLE